MSRKPVEYRKCSTLPYGQIRVKLLDVNCKPYRAHETDSGLDLRARVDGAIALQPMWSATVPVGLAVELPAGYEGQIRPRSGLAKKGVIVAFGTVDNGYRGEIKATLINTSGGKIAIQPYERIAQLVIAPVMIPNIQYVDDLPVTDRGDKGYGSTGRK